MATSQSQQTQTDEEYERERHARITGSRAKTILTGGYKGWNSLSKQMHAPPKFYGKDHPNMPEQLRRGNIWEHRARDDLWDSNPELTLRTPKFWTPEQFGQDFGDMTQWMGYSPDGELEKLDMTMMVLEIKTQSEEVWQRWSARGIVNPENMPQCQWGMMVTGYPATWYRAFCPREEGDQIYFDATVYPDRKMQDMLMAKMREFIPVHVAKGEFLPPTNESADIEALKDL